MMAAKQTAALVTGKSADDLEGLTVISVLLPGPKSKLTELFLEDHEDLGWYFKDPCARLLLDRYALRNWSAICRKTSGKGSVAVFGHPILMNAVAYRASCVGYRAPRLFRDNKGDEAFFMDYIGKGHGMRLHFRDRLYEGYTPIARTTLPVDAFAVVGRGPLHGRSDDFLDDPDAPLGSGLARLRFGPL